MEDYDDRRDACVPGSIVGRKRWEYNGFATASLYESEYHAGQRAQLWQIIADRSSESNHPEQGLCQIF